jgi:hypothetical protein
MLSGSQERLRESGTGTWEAEGGNESNEAGNKAICPTGDRHSCFPYTRVIGDNYANPGCASSPVTAAGCQEAAVVEFLLELIVTVIHTGDQ